jgi:V/A-type H+-transporting ATPase subunit I
VASHGPCSLDAEILPVPVQSPAAMRRRVAAIDKERKELTGELEALGTECAALQEHALSEEDELVIAETRVGMGEADPVCYLRGYCPPESVVPIQAEAARLGWGVVADEVRSDERAPTLIRTPKWVRPIRAVFDFIGVIPGYDEVDISALFLLFFSLFFAMIVGDAGYGALFLGMTLCGMKMFPRVPRNIYRLLLIMSCCTILYGLLTGNIFGLLSLPAPLAALKLEWMTGANAESNLMLLCFLIGAIHITLAHGWNLIRQFPHPSFLAQFGWICTTWAMFFVARLMVLNHPWPAVMTSILVAGVIRIAAFMTPVRRLKSEWFNHVMLPLNLISNFVDVVSYVRLYAVGMATFAVASAFNEMGAALLGGVLGTLAGALVIFFGHTLNIMLASMGVLVHGVRLNTLEFATHLGLQWSGVPFNPFAQKSQTNRKET